MYIFTQGVPNTTHATQETDQNYSLFKSQLRTNVKRLTSYLANKYREQITLHESNPDAHPYPKTLPSLSKSDYPRLVGGCDGELKLLPAFQMLLPGSKFCEHGEFVVLYP